MELGRVRKIHFAHAGEIFMMSLYKLETSEMYVSMSRSVSATNCTPYKGIRLIFANNLCSGRNRLPISEDLYESKIWDI